jgi:hypothetical protein
LETGIAAWRFLVVLIVALLFGQLRFRLTCVRVVVLWDASSDNQPGQPGFHASILLVNGPPAWLSSRRFIALAEF